MKNIIVIFILFFTIGIKSQDLGKIKKQNTFFILLDKNDTLAKFGCIEKEENPACNYRFFKSNIVEFEYSFFYHKYRGFDDFHNKMNQSMIFRIDKSFIRKNKDIIITRKFMKKAGKETMLSLLYNNGINKTIFLINTAETKGKKILVRQVSIDYTPVDPEPIIKNIIEYKP